MRTLGGNILSLRKELGLSQKDFGEKLGYSGRTVSDWENNLYPITVPILKKICEIYKVSYEEILDY